MQYFRKLILILAALALMSNRSTDEDRASYSIRSFVSGVSGKIDLMVHGRIIASTESDNGIFSFTGMVTFPSAATFLCDGEPFMDFFIENTYLTITGDTETNGLNITGSRANEQLMDLMSALKQRGLISSSGGPSLSIFNLDGNLASEYMTENLDNIFGIFLLNNLASRTMDPEEFLLLVSGLEEDVREHPYVTESIHIAQARRNLPKPPKDEFYLPIELSGPDGTVISLSEVLEGNKFVLIDFWASWCSPCIRDLPHLRNAYFKYKDKGFEIYSVSLDTKKKKWTEFIGRHGMIWKNVSSFEGWKCPAARQYEVRGIPSTFLLSSDGKILCKDINMEQLDRILSEYFDGNL